MKSTPYPRWQPLTPKNSPHAAAFLKAREPSCVNAGAQFLLLPRSGASAWLLHNQDGPPSAFLLLSEQLLFPVFARQHGLPPLPFLRCPWPPRPIYAIQGPRRDVAALEGLMPGRYRPQARFDYDLLELHTPPFAAAGKPSPPGLRLRRPRPSDMDALYLLQAAYEREEVLPRQAPFNPPLCRLSLERLVRRELLLVAEIDGRLVGKINTSARSFSYSQIGGVYVHPDYRRRGIARSMTTAFASLLQGAGRPLSLFVKKNNLPAQRLYRTIGFTPAGEYRIRYYEKN